MVVWLHLIAVRSQLKLPQFYLLSYHCFTSAATYFLKFKMMHYMNIYLSQISQKNHIYNNDISLHPL